MDVTKLLFTSDSAKLPVSYLMNISPLNGLSFLNNKLVL